MPASGGAGGEAGLGAEAVGGRDHLHRPPLVPNNTHTQKQTKKHKNTFFETSSPLKKERLHPTMGLKSRRASAPRLIAGRLGTSLALLMMLLTDLPA